MKNKNSIIITIFLASLSSNAPLFCMQGRRIAISRAAAHRYRSPQALSLCGFSTSSEQKHLRLLKNKFFNKSVLARELQITHTMVCQRIKKCINYGCVNPEKCRTKFVCLEQDRELQIAGKEVQRHILMIQMEIEAIKREKNR